MERTPNSRYLLGDKEGKFPYDELQIDDEEYYVDIFVSNRGDVGAKLVFAAQGNNAKIRFGPIGDWGYDATISFIILPNATSRSYSLYILPDENKSEFTIDFWTQDDEQMPPYQEINVFRPTFLKFENTTGGFVLTDQR